MIHGQPQGSTSFPSPGAAAHQPGRSGRGTPVASGRMLSERVRHSRAIRPASTSGTGSKRPSPVYPRRRGDHVPGHAEVRRRPADLLSEGPSAGRNGRPPITEPRIYFGEGPAGYVIVKTGAKEFDYPKGQENADTTYAGADGVPIGGTLWRTLLAWNLDDMNILLSGYLTDESRIILHRNIQERVRTIAPFLRLGRTGASSGHVVAGALVDCFQDLVRQRGPR